MGSCAWPVEVQGGGGEPNPASIHAGLQQAVVNFFSRAWRVCRSVLVSFAGGEEGASGGGKEGGCEGPNSLLGFISLFEGFLGCQKPLHSWAASRLTPG